jgi:hypothetical protein
MICFGICVYVATLHLTLARQGHAANVWVALWATGTAILQVARFSQLHATAPEHALVAGRVAAANFPVLLGGLAFVVRSLAGRDVSRRSIAVFAVTSAVFAAFACFTPAFIGAPWSRGPAPSANPTTAHRPGPRCR